MKTTHRSADALQWRTENQADVVDADNADQYSLLKILGIWAAVAIPMPILAFVVAPALATGYGFNYALTVWLLLIVGMIWQFVLSVIILYLELPAFTWGAIRERIWLNKPTNPRTGRRSYLLFLWLIPAFLFYAAIEMTPMEEWIGHLILIPLPFLDRLPVLELEEIIQPEFIGAWWLMGVAVIACAFNYVLGEELLFRGILLPKMRGVFGKWDWVANSVLFALYHLHRPTQMLAFIIGGFAYSLPSRYFRSIWFAIILHGIEGIPVLIGVYLVVSGRAF
ncbi:CPBP family intramembrane glutamic endopeptidase [Bauldia sp.]|uniref:CPBP family intramembrane glutamic endopeptidase n=1 Tax=Bauldia sp. TaxID=2575872 RepID=UPI003BA95469